jgi:3',5'-cyclic AMP phosphodiesterase CpdA
MGSNIVVLICVIQLLYCVLAQTSFFYFGDPQIGFGLEGWEKDVSRYLEAAKDAQTAQTKRVVIAGDLVNSYNNQTEIKGFAEVWPLQFGKVPVFLVPGNHDVNTETMLQHYRTLYGQDYYYQDFPSENSTFFFLDSEILVRQNQTDLKNSSTVHWEWLETTLPKFANVQHKFIVMHRPPFIKEENEPDSYWNWPTNDRIKLLSWVRQYSIKHLLCGHTHTTTNTRPTDGAFDIWTVGGTARVFDKNEFGYRVFTLDGANVIQQYVKLAQQTTLSCVDKPPYLCPASRTSTVVA